MTSFKTVYRSVSSMFGIQCIIVTIWKNNTCGGINYIWRAKKKKKGKKKIFLVFFRSPMKPRSEMYQTVCRDGFSLHIMFQASHKQWEVAILILINSSASVKIRIVKMDNWPNLNKCPWWDLICDPFASEVNSWTAGLRYLLALWLNFRFWLF